MQEFVTFPDDLNVFWIFPRQVPEIGPANFYRFEPGDRKPAPVGCRPAFIGVRRVFTNMPRAVREPKHRQTLAAKRRANTRKCAM